MQAPFAITYYGRESIKLIIIKPDSTLPYYLLLRNLFTNPQEKIIYHCLHWERGDPTIARGCSLREEIAQVPSFLKSLVVDPKRLQRFTKKENYVKESELQTLPI